MNTENTENQDFADLLLGYQRLSREAERKLKRYIRLQATVDTAQEEWEAAQKATDEAIAALKEALK